MAASVADSLQGELRGSRTEGIRSRRNGAHSERRGTVRLVFNAVNKEGALLVRAPPASGKSTLLMLCEEQFPGLAAERGEEIEVYRISLGQFDESKGEASFEEIWKAKYPQSPFDDVVSPHPSPESNSKPRPRLPPLKYLFIDEGQRAFNWQLKVFRKLKDIQEGSPGMRLRVVLVSSWGSNKVRVHSAAAMSSYGTPGNFDETNTISIW
jgi:hypothetical protein